MKHILVSLVASFFLLEVSAWSGSESSSVANYSEKNPNCKCVHNDCGCCEYLDWSIIKINGTVCSNFTYLPSDYGISVTVTYNTYTIFNDTISARNPPPMCLGIPELEKIDAHVCMRFYDLSFAQEHVHGCVRVSIGVFRYIHKSINIGCFNIPKAAFADAYTAKSRELFASIKNGLEELEYLKNDIPFVNMI